MNITRISPVKIYNTNFKSSAREYYDIDLCELGNVNYTRGRIYTDTELFRDDLRWGEFVRILEMEFMYDTKVPIYSLGCSDGSEAYSTSIALYESLPKPKKFFPIIAVDKDHEIINAAKSGRINLEDTDIAVLKAITSTNEEYFINPQGPINIKKEICIDKYSSYEPSNKLKGAVVFVEDDIINYLSKNSRKEKSVLMMRNVVPYLAINQQDTLYSLVKKFLTKGSLLIIGSYDAETRFKAILNKNVLNKEDFIKVGKNIYKRI